MLLYAPMSNVGKIMYDKDAMYIHLPSLHFTDDKSDLVQQHTVDETTRTASGQPCKSVFLSVLLLFEK